MTPILLSKAGAARLLGIGPRALNALLAAGIIRAIQVPGLKHPRILSESLQMVKDFQPEADYKEILFQELGLELAQLPTCRHASSPNLSTLVLADEKHRTGMAALISSPEAGGRDLFSSLSTHTQSGPFVTPASGIEREK